MSLRRYFEILGLPETASPSEIRKQYRRLAMRFHPDKDPSPEAARHFLRITEAYEILTGKKASPVVSAHSARSPKVKTHDERVKEARQRYYEQIIKEQQENERYFKALLRSKKWKLIRAGSYLGVVLSVALFMDLILPHHYEEDRLTHYSTDIYSSGPGRDNSVSLVRTETNNEFWIENIDYAFYGQYPELLVQRSWIFHDPVNLISKQKVKFVFYPVHYTFHSFSVVLILFFLLPAFTLYYKRQTILFTILFYISLYVSLGLIFLFLITNDHWAHLLSLGFL